MSLSEMIYQEKPTHCCEKIDGKHLEQQVAGQHGTEQQASEQQVTEHQVTEQCVSEHQVTEQQVTLILIRTR